MTDEGCSIVLQRQPVVFKVIFANSCPFLLLVHPAVTVMVDWALEIRHLGIYPVSVCV